jgi:hypothetical protein
MTMHLEGPWLSTTGKKKGKQKWASAEHKRRSEELDKEWKELKKRWGVETEQKKRDRAMNNREEWTYNMAAPPGRETKHIPSHGNSSGVAVLEPAKVYTGTKVLGIATMHKSNAVPVFSDEEAKSISSMRR